jgi:hypothetical protein
MGLSWDITKVEDYKNKCWVPVEEPGKVEVSFQVHPTTDAIIWACMAVDMGSITAKNAEEFYTRYRMFSRAIGRDRERWLTLEDIEAHIGMWTNVTTRTKGQFHKRVAEIMRDTAERVIRYERESAEGGEE